MYLFFTTLLGCEGIEKDEWVKIVWPLFSPLWLRENRASFIIQIRSKWFHEDSFFPPKRSRFLFHLSHRKSHFHICIFIRIDPKQERVNVERIVAWCIRKIWKFAVLPSSVTLYIPTCGRCNTIAIGFFFFPPLLIESRNARKQHLSTSWSTGLGWGRGPERIHSIGNHYTRDTISTSSIIRVCVYKLYRTLFYSMYIEMD